MAEIAQEKKKPVVVDDKIHTWPNLVRNEFLCAMFVMIVLILWALLIDAPLEEPANPTRTPNPSKAPWYFLGLQEMLVYFDPWNAGVVMPSLIIVGLMVIPFIDINPKGSGYYCFKDRKYEILTFFLGFHVLWVSMIMIGTFFRGPGWNLFWPWQRWDPHKVVALTNIDLPYLLGFRDYKWSAVFRGHRSVPLVGDPNQGKGVHGTLGTGALCDHCFPLRNDGGSSREDVPAPGFQREIHHGHALA